MAAKTSFLVISVFTLKLKRFPVENSMQEGDERRCDEMGWKSAN